MSADDARRRTGLPGALPPNRRLDGLLAEFAALLGPAEDALLRRGEDTSRPVVLVIGSPRGGTTLMTQWLAASGRFAVPTNLLARFSRTPALGARIQLLLTDPAYAFGDELFDLASARGDFASSLGKTRGALAPNEFAFFWRRFLGTRDLAPLGDEGVARADWEGIRATFAELERLFGRALAMKGMFVQYDLEAAATSLPRAFFLRVRRDPVANGAALLQARERRSGDRAMWYSARPAEYERLVGLDPVRQVAGQVYFTERSLDRGLARVPAGRQLTLDYERFCEAPAVAWESLRGKLAALSCDVGAEPPPVSRFQSTTAARAASPDALALQAALAELAAEVHD